MTKNDTRSTKRALCLFVSLAAFGIAAAHCGAPPTNTNDNGRPKSPVDIPTTPADAGAD